MPAQARASTLPADGLEHRGWATSHPKGIASP